MRDRKPTAPPPDASPSSDEQRHRLLFEASPLPMWVYDLETLRFLDVNEVACQKYGYSRDEFLAMTIRDIRPAEDVALVEASVRDTPRHTFNSGVWRHRLKDGTLINVEITSHEMVYLGRRTRFVCPIDVTQRVRAEAALRESEAGLRRAQSMARLGHVITRPDGSFESWSETLPALAGTTPAQMPHSTRDWLRRLVHPEDRPLFRARSLEAAATGNGVDIEYRLPQADGSTIHVRQVIEPIVATGTHDGGRWFSTLQDITEQKQAEARVLRLNEELERRVRERTAQLEVSNQDLALATAAAERANRAKSEFLSNMSHELRTPLNAIIGFGQLLGSGAPSRPPEKQALFVDHIVKAGRHLLTLINEILNLAQIEAGRLAVAIDRVGAAEVLAECEAMIEPMAAQRGVRIVFARRVDLAVMADRTRLKQVLLNLLSNAVKYNRMHGLVRIDCLQQDSGRVRFMVQDTGAGLRPDQLQSLFQPFNRLGQESNGEEGSGIGLVVTKRLVELMGGTIGVQSTPGVGSLFWIELEGAPAYPPTPGAAQRVPERGVAEHVAAAATAAQVATVLCVEDNPASLRLVQEVLAGRSDVQLLSASNGRLGVELARSHVPAVILMDNNMPEMSGREAHAILRNDPRTAGIPIIALSANAMPNAVDEGLAAGFFRYLTKPFDVKDLLVALDDALAQSRERVGH
ncbi:MAG TPA: ATP-binding protein [Albitalea sp.]|uniref:PAS domain-containing hybrid sensor histidine kinase/response regulator n=1 Tax=Piscinibacter sp. TaxID=1903157 RepID=UPI002ED47EB7